MSPSSPHCRPETLARLIEQELDPQELADIEAHLGQCPDCRRLLDEAAAPSDLWTEASRFLTDDEFDSIPPESGVSRHPDADDVDNLDHDPENILKRLSPWLDATDDPRMLGRFGGYEILGIIGEGGMGIVLKGFEAPLNRYVAIKVLAPHLAGNGAARQRFSREARAAAAVLHENVIAIHRVEENRGLPYLVMPYIAGESLQKRLDDLGPLPLVNILRIGRQIAAGLAAAHAQGLVHRDVKPANILLERGVDRVTLTDFGLARAVDDATVTRSGVIAGTPQYMSPEQARGDNVDARSDLFSLAGVLYAMSAGRPPFRAETSFGILRRITDDEPRPISEINPEIPRWFELFVQRLHRKQPDHRFQTPEEVAQLMEDCLAHVQQPANTPVPPELTEPPKRRSFSRWATIAASLFLLIPLVGSFFLYTTLTGFLQQQILSEDALENSAVHAPPAIFVYRNKAPTTPQSQIQFPLLDTEAEDSAELAPVDSFLEKNTDEETPSFSRRAIPDEDASADPPIAPPMMNTIVPPTPPAHLDIDQELQSISSTLDQLEKDLNLTQPKAQ